MMGRQNNDHNRPMNFEACVNATLQSQAPPLPCAGLPLLKRTFTGHFIRSPLIIGQRL